MSAVILAVIVIMWAVVLVPMWLRRHDAATESRSVDKFSAAMRVLSRRQPSSGSSARYVLMPRRGSSAVPSVHVSGAAAPSRPVPSRPAQSRPAQPRPAAPRGKASLAVRRRRVLLGLLGVAFLTMMLAAAGVMGWVLQIVVDLIAVAFVVHLRNQARRSAALAQARRRPAPVSVPAPVPVAAPAIAPTPTAARYAAQLAQPAALAEPEVPAASASASASVEAAEEVAAATGTDDASAWEPVPVPPPTYTMKPAAPPRYYPPVEPDWDAEPDLVDGGVGDEAVAAAAEPAVAPEDDGQLDEILTHRWAVND